jgi:hypothetical protein
MIEKVSKSTKICATCAVWGGQRSSEYGYALVDSSATGKCHDKNSEMSKGSECRKWEVWPMLR